MNEFQPFDRIGAFIGIDEHHSYFLGYGIYTGDWIDPAYVECMPEEMLKPFTKVVKERNKNPLLMLENGDTVWGRECWWSDVETFDIGIKLINHEPVRIGLIRTESLVRQGIINYDTQVKEDAFKVDFSDPIFLD